MKAIFTKDFGNKKAGQIINVDSMLFKQLKDAGVLVEYKEQLVHQPEKSTKEPIKPIKVTKKK
jgi:hypothetical protein